ncbi:MAG: hypothetical protein LC725_12140, partial [Lentisphaerae bacterium]|nr:hypothetical protein [Lentisphaerota bacterium]
DCGQLLQNINRLSDSFRELSHALGEALDSQYEGLAHLFWIDRASDVIFTLGGSALGSAINIARVTHTSQRIMHGSRLGVDLARGGSLTGPGVSASAEYATAMGGSIGGFVSKQTGSQAGSAVRRRSRRGTAGVRQMMQDTIDSLNYRIEAIRSDLSGRRDLYRRCCQ